MNNIEKLIYLFSELEVTELSDSELSYLNNVASNQLVGAQKELHKRAIYGKPKVLADIPADEIEKFNNRIINANPYEIIGGLEDVSRNQI